MKAIYYPGETNLQSTIRMHANGIELVDYTTKTTEEYLAELRDRYPDKPEPLVLALDEALALVETAQRAKYAGPWAEITEEQWMEALAVLPPENWQTVAGVEIFRMMEYLTGSITAHYARLGERYFSANRCARTKYAEIAAELFTATLAKADDPPPCPACNAASNGPIPPYCPEHDGDYSTWLAANNID